MAARVTIGFSWCVFALTAATAMAESVPRVDPTQSTAIAPLAGQSSTPAQGQEDIGFWGTDMGFYFELDGALWFLFGDTVREPGTGAHILSAPGEPPGDDALGIVCVRNGPLCPAGKQLFPSGDAVDTFVRAHPAPLGLPQWRSAGPPVHFATSAVAGTARIKPISVFHHSVTPREMIVPIPGPGFNNHKVGEEQGAFAVFNGPIARCSWGCPEGFECLTEAGVYQPSGPDEGGHLPCKLPSTDPACIDVGGVCIDPTSPLREQSKPDVAFDQCARRFELGNAERPYNNADALPSRFITQSWITHKMTNPAMTTVNDFDESRSIQGAARNDYRVPQGEPSDRHKLFIWSRPGFALNGKSWTYFAYADLPSYSATADFEWRPRYFTGSSAVGVPQFSEIEAEAKPLVLNQTGEPKTDEPWDLVNMISVRWVEPIKQWVMLYGGGSTWSPPPTGAQFHPENAVFIRFAHQPFGPWSEPQVLFAAGDPNLDAEALRNTAYGPGGILYHTGCTSDDCAPGESFWSPGIPPFAGQPYGFLYSPNLIQEWSTARDTPTRGVDIYWTVSTFAPYQVVLMRSFLEMPTE
jgi:hypothetical protein